MIAHFNLISCYCARIVRRSWVFRIFSWLLPAAIIGYQFYIQSNLFFGQGLFKTVLASFIPHTTVYLLSWSMILPLAFVAIAFFQKKHTDTDAVLMARPESNAAWVLGAAWGILRPFLRVGAMTLCVIALMHLLASEAPFDGWLYVIYFATIYLPSLVCWLGVSMLTGVVVRNRGLGLLVLMGCLSIMVLTGDACKGLFDPLGVTLPAIFSELAGHPGPGIFLWQRCTWLLLGVALTGVAVVLFPRLVNTPGAHRKHVTVAWLLLAGAIGSGTGLFVVQQQEENRRCRYRETGILYRNFPKLDLAEQEMVFRHRGNKMTLDSRITLLNNHKESVESVILYLNPGLKVERLTRQGEVLPFTRENQVILLDCPVSAGDSLVLEVTCSGKIDEAVCYLDVTDTEREEMGRKSYLYSRLGCRYAFLQPRYVLLIPECLWYPVAHPPANPANPYDLSRDFTRYTLRVEETSNRLTPVSQGNREIIRGATIFRSDQPLSGLALSLGDYTSYTKTVDSTESMLYVFRGHEDFTEGFHIDESKPHLSLGFLKKTVEGMFERPYPYKRIMLSEVPLSFASYTRPAQGGSEWIQPEWIFIPERAVGINSFDQAGQKKYQAKSPPVQVSGGTLSLNQETDLTAVFGVFLFPLGQTSDGSRSSIAGLLKIKKTDDFESQSSPYNLTKIFHTGTGQIYSSDYPVIGAVIDTWVSSNQFVPDENLNNTTLAAQAYLEKHNFPEALEDRSLAKEVVREIITLKVNQFQHLFAEEGAHAVRFYEFLQTHWRTHPFHRTSGEELEQAFQKEFGFPMNEKMTPWYHGNQMPAFRIKKATAERVEGTGRLVRITVSLFNESPEKGLVTLMTGKFVPGFSHAQTESHSYPVEGRSGKEIVLILENPIYALLELGLSRNIPSRVSLVSGIPPGTTKDTLAYIKDIDSSRFYSSPGLFIADNEDESFRVYDGTNRQRLRMRAGGRKLSQPYRLYDMADVSGSWSACVGKTVWGEVVRSAMVKLPGKGDGYAEWSVVLDQPGTYEVYAYISQIPANHQFLSLSRENRRRMATTPQPLRQYYAISDKNNRYEAVLETTQWNEWISLGSYRLEAGENRIRLSDRSDLPHQLIYADAVKWVRTGAPTL